jgi:hypothetical protein
MMTMTRIVLLLWLGRRSGRKWPRCLPFEWRRTSYRRIDMDRAFFFAGATSTKVERDRVVAPWPRSVAHSCPVLQSITNSCRPRAAGPFESRCKRFRGRCRIGDGINAEGHHDRRGVHARCRHEQVGLRVGTILPSVGWWLLHHALSVRRRCRLRRDDTQGRLLRAPLSGGWRLP